MSLKGCDTGSRYSVDLVDLHSHCEGNYLRMLRLFPDYEQANQCHFEAGDAQIDMTVTDRSRYTTTLQLIYCNPVNARFGGVRLEVRLYHDARMAEVIGFQSHRRVQGRYQYPNKKMYQRDEKQQQNRFLAELLAFCLSEGRQPLPLTLGGDGPEPP